MLIEKIKQLKQEKQAVILAHYYQRPEVQDVADYIGDSLDLSRIAAKTNAKIIVFCGVNFMAETAKILSPDKKVLLPVADAGCPMAMMINEKKLREYKQQHPDRVVICYVNSYASVKALSDVCVTSSNAEKIIRRFQHQKICYVPDKNLGLYLKEKYQLDLETWPGYCCIHNNLKPEQVQEMRHLHPNAKVLIHPEAPLEVLRLADYVGSTSGIIRTATESADQEFIIGTEEGILYPLRQKNPEKKFYLLNKGLLCRNMKKTTLPDVLRSLETETHEIIVEESVRIQARRSLDLMLEWSQEDA
ncbi:MAG: quinolinate synthase NadA [Candidatus Izemoplasmatales bacterium]|jgi:quinolinate synthase|nr:quinolinate synthase NadA [Candidatus Izemoplasmatales bacterium]MDD4987562.1 quinolinate synthase NadA [Candidatus Izemoplasmatales bacterium]MDY0372599.1 quinolinate synthase NadA [Candidatus Izemoplasmatales bacterium]NLF48277.1 quinolinate synthase NadA [Acholeplasmataceae bacterium]